MRIWRNSQGRECRHARSGDFGEVSQRHYWHVSSKSIRLWKKKNEESSQDIKNDRVSFIKRKDIALENSTPRKTSVSFKDVHNGLCRWPQDGMMCCGARCSKERVYCKDHERIAYVGKPVKK